MDDQNLRDVARRVARRTIESGYSGFNWGEGVAWYAVWQASQAFEDSSLLDSAVKWVESHSDVVPSTMLDATPGLAVLEIAETSSSAAARTLAERIADYLMRYPRSELGAHRHPEDHDAGTLVAVDYWYLSTPMLMRMAVMTGDERYYQRAAELAFGYVHSCWSSTDALFSHTYDDVNHARAPWHWGRASGWALLALVETLIGLPEGYAVKPILQGHLLRNAERLRALQDEAGAWHTLVDRSETYAEVSATAMIARGLGRALSHGYLDDSYANVVDRAMAFIVHAVTDEGDVERVSGWTPPGGYSAYSDVPLGVFPWGQGMVLSACLAALPDVR